MVSELRAIRQTVLAVARIGQANTGIEQQTSNKITNLIDVIRAAFSRDKFSQAVSNLEKGDPTQSTTNAPEERAKTSLWAALLGIAGGFIGEIATHFKSFSKIFGKLFKVGEEGIKPIEGIIKVFGRFGKLAEGIPIVGEFIVVATTLFDAFKGFVKGFTGTKGGIFTKTLAGFEEAVKSVWIGILDIPKMVLQLVKGISTFLVRTLGFKDLANKMENFKLGKWWDDTIGKAIENFNPMSVIKQMISTITDWFSKLIGSLPTNVKDLLALINNTVVKPVINTVGAVGNGASNLFHGAHEMVTRLAHGIGHQTTASTNISLEGRALLDSIGDKEGTNRYHNSGYNTLVGGGTISDLSKHPGVIGLRTAQGNSTAFGRYQITKSTYKSLMESHPGMFSGKFTEQDQDKMAWVLAQDRYRAITHRDLTTDLKDSSRHATIEQALSGTWASFKGGVQQRNGMLGLHDLLDLHKEDESKRDAAAKAKLQPPKPKMINPGAKANHQVSTLDSMKAFLGMGTIVNNNYYNTVAPVTNNIAKGGNTPTPKPSTRGRPPGIDGVARP